MGFGIWELSNLWQRQFNQELEPTGLTHAQFLILAGACELSREAGQGISQSTIAKWAHTDKMMTSKLVRTLTAKKFLKRGESKTDSRANTVSPTDRGIKACKQATAVMQRFEKAFFAPLRKEKGVTKRIEQIVSRR